ncbi:MAG: GHKL domain-containing protein, partial [Deltaproteobacteria bacterium]|nr:GHKL domain-containing protein [Deltaproteobacteria bacterium]
TFSRQSNSELKRVDLNRLLEKTLFLNANQLKIGGVKVEKKLDPDLPRLTGSEDHLQQVFMNLISNAAEAINMNGGGTLSIETGHSLKEGAVIIRVKDEGVGISKENLSRLFEPFFTTKKKGKGVGLGLSVAYGIIKEHGGSIHVETEMEKGTIFQVELPLKRISDTLDPDGGPYG